MSSVDSLQNLILNGWIPQASNKQNGDTHSVSSNTKNWEFRLCLKNVPKNYKETEIQKLYHVRSENVHFLKNNPDKQHDVQMAFVQFSSKSDAESALNQINSNKTTNIRASFAEKPKQNQRNSRQHSVANSTSSFPITSVSEQTKSYKSKEELIGPCERCGLNAKDVCDVCGSFYCSSACQRKDWLTHKLICKPMPKLVKASKKYGSTSESNDDDDSGTDNENTTNASGITMTNETKLETSSTQKIKFIVPFVDCPIVKNATVVMTAISSINRLYVRVCGGDYKKVNAEIAAYVLKTKKQETIPEVDDVVLAPFDGIFYRAQVLSINTPDAEGNDLVVLFIDYGNISKVSSKNLKKLDYKHRSLKRHAFKVILSDVNCRIVNEAALHYLNDLLTNKEQLLVSDVSSNPNDRIVTLLKSSTGENVNDTIMRLSVVDEVTDSEEVVMCNDFKPMPLPTGREMTLFVTDCGLLDSGLIACMPMESVQELLLTEKAIEEYGFRTKDMKYSPIHEELCLILVDKHWYRAAVVDQVPNRDEFVFYLIDWCRLESNISNENIRKMPKQFGDPRPKAHICCILDRSSIKAQLLTKQAKVNLTFTVNSIVLNDEQQYCLQL